MQFFQGPLSGRKVVCGLAAVTSLGVLALAQPASAGQAPAPGGYYQSYVVRPRFDVSSIIIYQTTFDSTGITNSFTAHAPSEVLTDPFLKVKPIEQNYLMGVSTFGDQAPGAQEHLILALNNTFAHSVLTGGLDFGDIFTGFDETSLIQALDLLTVPDLADDDPGKADQATAKDNAYDLLFNFSSALVTDGGTFGPSSGFKLVAFSTPTDYGDGDAVVTPAAVPEPASWALMILGFGGVGWVLRQRRGRDGLAPA